MVIIKRKDVTKQGFCKILWGVGGTRKGGGLGVSTYLNLSLSGREAGCGWALIPGWAIIKFFCLYSNKYGNSSSFQSAVLPHV